MDAGAFVNDTNEDQDSPLHLACLHLQPDSVRALLRRDADHTLCNEEFDVPWDIVGHCVPEDQRDEEVVEWIREVRVRVYAVLRAALYGAHGFALCAPRCAMQSIILLKKNGQQHGRKTFPGCV